MLHKQVAPILLWRQHISNLPHPPAEAVTRTLREAFLSSRGRRCLRGRHHFFCLTALIYPHGPSALGVRGRSGVPARQGGGGVDEPAQGRLRLCAIDQQWRGATTCSWLPVACCQCCGIRHKATITPALSLANAQLCARRVETTHVTVGYVLRC